MMGLFRSISNIIAKGTTENEIAGDVKHIALSDLPPCYNIDLLKWSKRSECYLLIGENTEKATADIMKLNLFLIRAKKLLRSFPENHFVDGQLRFDEPRQNAYHSFCRLIAHPYTSTGKLPKFPIELFADASDKLFARVYYQQNGEIGKAEIISWSDRCYEISLAMIDGAFDIKAIYVTNPVTHEKQKMYFIPPAKEGSNGKKQVKEM